VGELHPGGLRQRQVQLLLEVLVHDVDHPVAEAPQEEQAAHEREGQDEVAPVPDGEEASLGCGRRGHGVG
jgi:hypothetical protein